MARAKKIAEAVAAVINNAPVTGNKRKPRSPKPADAPAWALDADRLTKLGTDMVNAAVGQVKEGGTFWDCVRTQYVDAQAHGAGEAALVAIFAPGEKIKGKKAPWYRTYKSLLTNAHNRGIVINNEMGMGTVQAAIKASKEEEVDSDPAKAAEKQANLITMFERLAKGCLSSGVTKAKLAEVLKNIEV